jgi:hypothetical protein
MRSWIRFVTDSALLVMTMVTGGLVLYLAAPRARPCPVVHPAGCHACSANAPPAVVAARDAELARIEAIEIQSPSDPW